MNISVSRKGDITVRELGGCMSPIWNNYYCGNQAIMVRLQSTVEFLYGRVTSC